MPKATDIRVVEAVLTFEPCPFRTPLKFGGRVQDKARLANVQVTVESRGKKHAVGFGSMPLGAAWAWPSTTVAPEQTEQAMAAFAQELIDIVADFDQFEHPLDLMFDLSGEYEHLGKQVSTRLGLPEPLPRLAQLVAASPLDAAIHDAFGRIHRVNSFNALSKSFVNRDLSDYLDAQFKGEYLDQYTLREPQPRLPLYHLVGALDPLTKADVARPVGDGLPESLADWTAAEGLTHFKIKLHGDDAAWDLDRVLAVDRVVSEVQARRGVSTCCYSADFNEQCRSVEYILELLKQLQARSPSAYQKLQYLEQPTHRDLKAHPENRMHAAAELKPVVIDESLVDYESLLLAREQGYSGVALKACKGQSEALFAAAAAQKFGMFLCVQDLTCPGFSFLHSASLAAHIPTVAAIEGNGRQYCPAANKKWARSFPGMFDIKQGTVATGVLGGEGLGGF
jgi:L-alanine-DL-glutamate epimerase-like enolase superfamily enzyme